MPCCDTLRSKSLWFRTLSVGTPTGDVTCRERLGELQARFGWNVFSGQTYRDCMAWLVTTARVTDQSLSLSTAIHWNC